MEGELLCLKWRDHGTTLFRMLSSVRRKEVYCDATIACGGRFYPVHKFVLSTCSEYFEQMFEIGEQKNLMIVLTDIGNVELETLLDYMYFGEVNVLQSELTTFMRAAEQLRIKGLGAPSETFSEEGQREKRKSCEYESDWDMKRRRLSDEASYLSSRSTDAIDTSDNSFQYKDVSVSPTYKNQLDTVPKTKITTVKLSSNQVVSQTYRVNESPKEATSPLSSTTHSSLPEVNRKGPLVDNEKVSQIKFETCNIKDEPEEWHQSEMSGSESIFSSPDNNTSLMPHGSNVVPVSSSGSFESSADSVMPSEPLDCTPHSLPGPSTLTAAQSWDQQCVPVPLQYRGYNQRKTGRPISDIWNHYRTEKINGKTYVICSYCTVQKYGYPNATKMKIHTVKCKHSPENVKEQYKKELADIMAKNEANKLQYMRSLSLGCESGGYSSK
ncbi:hypothetical protein SK128_018610 [Halocaridina rubra]|uniref:BTB domain-containing protein n=1 Tax=Halocaridina rubra TaxID=373956 RepID=A0AAN8XDP0_HALRR